MVNLLDVATEIERRVVMVTPEGHTRYWDRHFLLGFGFIEGSALDVRRNGRVIQ